MLKIQANATYNALPYIWSWFIISFVFGLYIALLFVKKWSLQINWSLLICVCVPFILLTLTSPIITLLSSLNWLPSNFPLPAWFFSIYSSNTFGIIAGLTLLLSLFSGKAREA